MIHANIPQERIDIARAEEQRLIQEVVERARQAGTIGAQGLESLWPYRRYASGINGRLGHLRGRKIA